LDQEGHVCILYVHSDDPPIASSTTRNQTIRFGRERNGRFESVVVEPLKALRHNLAAHVENTIALATAEGRIAGIYGRPRLDIGETAVDLVLYNADSPAPRELEVLNPEPANLGYRTTLFFDQRGQVLVTHFTFGGYYFLCTARHGGTWETRALGRQGDGRPGVAVLDSQGRIHASSRLVRYGSDCGLLDYLQAPVGGDDFHPARTTGQIWKSLVTADKTGDIAIAVDPAGSPAILCTRLRPGRKELMLYRRHESGWRSTVLLSPLPEQYQLSNLVARPDGQIQFAYTRTDNGKLYVILGTVGQDHCTEEPVATISLPASPSPGDRYLAPILRLDKRSAPVVILVRQSSTDGRITVFRQPP
jgi:hypothetical protein